MLEMPLKEKRKDTKRVKKKSALEITGEQYEQLKQQLAIAGSVQEKNMIFRRLINLLGVMEFLTMNQRAPEAAPRRAARPPAGGGLPLIPFTPVFPDGAVQSL